MSRRVLVTGATGFLGGYAARHLSSAGFRVAGLGHGNLPQAEWSRLGVSGWTCGDVSVAMLIGGKEIPDVIFHCAGGASVSASVADPEGDFHRTVESTRAVLEYIRFHAPKARLVLPSSAAVYGDVARLPISEDARLAPISPYGVHKKMSEELCRSYAAKYGLKIAIVRLFSVYGPGLRKQLLWDACEKFQRGETGFFGTGEERRDWLHADDAATLLAAAAENASEHCPIVNGGSGKAVTVMQILLRLAAAFPSAGPLCFSGVARQGDPVGYQANISRARGWAWHPRVAIEQGITEYAEWYRGLAA